MKKKHRQAQQAERLRCVREAERVVAQFDGMGFRHNADKAAGARAVPDAIRVEPLPENAHQVTHVAGLTTVYES